MKPFDLAEPTTLEDALALLSSEDGAVRPISGGTALMLMMKARLFQPTQLVSLRKLNGAMKGITADGKGALRIGAMTTLSEMERSADVARAFPVIHDALHTLSNVRIRNVATLGGHLAHGDPHMDLPPILVTLGARVKAASAKGERWIDIADVFVGYYTTSIGKHELITEVEIPAQPAGVHAAYAKFAALSADDWPSVGVAVWYTVKDAKISGARISVSAATEKPVRASAAEAALIGASATPQTFAKAGDAAADEVEPLADIRGTSSYKREMVRVHVRRALAQALQPAKK